MPYRQRVFLPLRASTGELSCERRWDDWNVQPPPYGGLSIDARSIAPSCLGGSAETTSLRYSCHAMSRRSRTKRSTQSGRFRGPHRPIDPQTTTLLAVLEYAHAIWSCFPSDAEHELPLAQSVVASIVDLVDHIRHTALAHSLASSSRSGGGAFDSATGLFEFTARSTWITLRGNRYQVLEGEFFAFVLEPHDAALQAAYGVSARVVSDGIQRLRRQCERGLATRLTGSKVT
jgi:hypothetical protein